MIRPATVEDFPRILEMIGHFCAESVYGRLLGDTPAGARRVLELAQIHGATYVVEIGNPRGTLIGFACVIAAPNPISLRLCAEEMAWWVEPEHRGGRAAYALLQAIKTWARQKGCHVLKMVAPAAAPKVGAFYRRLGLDEIESAFVWWFDD